VAKKNQIRRKLHRSRTANSEPTPSCLAELAEAQEILLPELAARIAAIEHLLIEKSLCTRDELKRARAFINIQETS